jgi:hypothetical protein
MAICDNRHGNAGNAEAFQRDAIPSGAWKGNCMVFSDCQKAVSRLVAWMGLELVQGLDRLIAVERRLRPGGRTA